MVASEKRVKCPSNHVANESNVCVGRKQKTGVHEKPGPALVSVQNTELGRGSSFQQLRDVLLCSGRSICICFKGGTERATKGKGHYLLKVIISLLLSLTCLQVTIHLIR